MTEFYTYVFCGDDDDDDDGCRPNESNVKAIRARMSYISTKLGL